MATGGGKRVLYEEIAGDIRQKISSGDLAPGAQVGPLSRLQEEYGTALGTVNNALRLLRDEGWLTSIPGKGVYVAAVIPPPGIAEQSKASEPMTKQLAEIKAEVAQLREALSLLQAHVINLYHSVGQPYPGETPARPERRRQAVNG
jgi:DNA-binding GntR family transcriptional regulator